LQRKDAVFSRLVDGQHFSSTYKAAVARGRGAKGEAMVKRGRRDLLLLFAERGIK
jgi:hypothetical protein